MDNKMKGIIGGVVGLVVILILVFSFGGSSNSPEAVAEKAISIGEKVLSGAKSVEDKEDVKSLYKETVNDVADIIPGALAGLQDFIESNGGIEEIGKPEKTAELMGEFSGVIGDLEALGNQFEELGKDKDLQKKLEKIGDSMTESDFAELLKFTLDTANALIEKIANDEAAMEGLNFMGSINNGPKVTKKDLLDIVKDYEKELKDMDAKEMAEYFGKMF